MNLLNFEFDPQEKFEPSPKAKKASLYSYKKKYNVTAGMTMPGFFQTTGFPWHVIGFLMIFILEGLATAWSFEEGASVQIIIGLILFDVVLAIASHVKHADYTELSNQIFFADSHIANRLERSRKQAIIWRNTFFFLILASAIIKFAFFFMIYLFFDATALLIAVCYIIGGILHILCTGYAIFTIFHFWPKIKGDHSKYVKSDGKNYVVNPLDHEIETKLQLKEVQVGRHKLYQKDDSFYLYTEGVLTDAELRNMIARQVGDEEKRILAVAGVSRQHSILSTAPLQGVAGQASIS